MKRTAVVLASLAMALSSMFVGTASAQPVSVQSWSQCPLSRFCVWEHYVGGEGTAPWAYFQTGSPDLSKAINGHVFNDKISAAYNRTGQVWCLYEHKDYNSTGQGKIKRIGNWRGFLSDFNDITSSLRPC